MCHIPCEYQTDNLFLLVGTNPLPNLVAANLLVKPGGTVHLVCSADTTVVARRLEEVLTGQCSVSGIRKIEVRETDALDIENKVRSAARSSHGTIGLHYTGGTKTMAVHAYRAVEREMACADSPPVFSYLDAGSFELRIGPSWREKVLLHVEPALGDLLALHGITLKRGSPKHEVVLADTANALARAAPGDGMRSWREWCTRVLRAKGHDGRRWRKTRDLLSVRLPLPAEPPLRDAAAALKLELGLPADAEDLPLNPSEFATWPFPRPESRYLCQWLDGIWLEHCVLSQIQAVAGSCQLHDCAMSLETDRISPPAFEFDVAALRGYQLFGMSCTTSGQKGLCKQKLFEVYIRARQLGGDEARVGLVSGYGDPAALEGEMEVGAQPGVMPQPDKLGEGFGGLEGGQPQPLYIGIIQDMLH